MPVHRQGRGAGDTSLEPQTFFPEKECQEAFKLIFLPFWPASSCSLIYFCFWHQTSTVFLLKIRHKINNFNFLAEIVGD